MFEEEESSYLIFQFIYNLYYSGINHDKGVHYCYSDKILNLNTSTTVLLVYRIMLTKLVWAKTINNIPCIA